MPTTSGRTSAALLRSAHEAAVVGPLDRSQQRVDDEPSSHGASSRAARRPRRTAGRPLPPPIATTIARISAAASCSPNSRLARGVKTSGLICSRDQTTRATRAASATAAASTTAEVSSASERDRAGDRGDDEPAQPAARVAPHTAIQPARLVVLLLEDVQQQMRARRQRDQRDSATETEAGSRRSRAPRRGSAPRPVEVGRPARRRRSGRRSEHDETGAGDLALHLLAHPQRRGVVVAGPRSAASGASTWDRRGGCPRPARCAACRAAPRARRASRPRPRASGSAAGAGVPGAPPTAPITRPTFAIPTFA